MKLPRDLSGREVAEALVRKLDYRVVHERGSHIVLQTDAPSHQRIAIPDHKNLRLGTLNAILKAVASQKHIEKDAVIALLQK
ncbi:MAG: type II toxin-antitoxin system HicA family toxin [Spirochaetia bacterium]|jgi:predicted RNA binding protein YcfA (HicA-like mRNA interferase family)